MFGCQVNSQKWSKGIRYTPQKFKYLSFLFYFSISRVYLACSVPVVQCKQTAEGCARSLPYSEHSCARLGQSSYMGILGASLDQGQKHNSRGRIVPRSRPKWTRIGGADSANFSTLQLLPMVAQCTKRNSSCNSGPFWLTIHHKIGWGCRRITFKYKEISDVQVSTVPVFCITVNNQHLFLAFDE